MTIEVRNAAKSLGKISVLQDVDLTLNSGTIYGLRGVNGSGKTMLMRLLAGLIRPSKGIVRIDGKELGKELSFPPDMGMLIENPAFLGGYTAAQNLRFLAGIRKKVGEDRIRQVLKQVGLDDTDKRKYRQFSLGMKQRLGIAGAVLEHPQLLLMDEPTNALDTDGVEMVRYILQEERAQGALIVLACHDFNVLENLSDVIYSVKEGRVNPL